MYEGMMEFSDVSVFIGRFFGFYLLIVAVALLVNRKRLISIVKSFADNPALMIFSGFVNLVLGLLAVMFHNIWVSDWRLVVTILAWLTLVKGLGRWFFPDVAKKMAVKVNDRWVVITALSCLVVGLYLLSNTF